MGCLNTATQNVALRKESVDRNSVSGGHNYIGYSVALRKESVDRNLLVLVFGMPTSVSLSARRAWIEMQDQFLRFGPRNVALRKESVDRNIMYVGTGPAKCRRSPQGERG